MWQTIAAGPPVDVVTFSGARIAPISTSLASRFLEQVGVRASVHDLALGALTDAGELLGVVVIERGQPFATSIVEVAPARRRLGIEVELRHALARVLTATPPSASTAWREHSTGLLGPCGAG